MEPAVPPRDTRARVRGQHSSLSSDEIVGGRGPSDLPGCVEENGDDSMIAPPFTWEVIMHADRLEALSIDKYIHPSPFPINFLINILVSHSRFVVRVMLKAAAVVLRCLSSCMRMMKPQLE
jgi:hypothetical protein